MIATDAKYAAEYEAAASVDGAAAASATDGVPATASLDGGSPAAYAVATENGV